MKKIVTAVALAAGLASAPAFAQGWYIGATYGIGARYLFTKEIGLFAEWMKNDKIEVDSDLIGLDFRF
jgi:hypothetical protein